MITINNRVSFADVVMFARFCAALTAEGIAFHGGQNPDGGFSIIITGF